MELNYSYAGKSRLVGAPRDLALTLVVPVGEDGSAPSEFLRARARAPEVTARALRAISETVAARYYVPPSMLARILREADPVATVNASAVRFEGFSACSSVYIRLDMDDAALDVNERQAGTTNVDFGSELRSALAQVRGDSELDITIGAHAVGFAHGAVEIVERKVPLPVRWIKGFGEVQLRMAGMCHAFTLPGIAAQRFLRALPRSKSEHLQWVSEIGGQARIGARASRGTVPLRGGHRLGVFGPLVRFAREMRVYAHETQGSTAWVLDFGAQRLTLVLNAEPWRGFSGDGGLLSNIAVSDAAAVTALKAQLHWQDRIKYAELAAATNLPEARVKTGLAQLAAIGLVGFDLAAQGYFHRVLPFGLAQLPGLNPRLKAAMALVRKGAVTIASNGTHASIASKDVTHEVRIDLDGMRCTCPWYAKHKGARGPCKHTLAVEIASGRAE